MNMTDLLHEDFDLTEELVLLELAGAPSERYSMHSMKHMEAYGKYQAAVKNAKSSGNDALARRLNKIGKKHKEAGEALAAIAGHHVDAAYTKELNVRKTAMPMPINKVKSIKEDTDMDHEDVLHKHGWRSESGDRDETSYAHSEHPDHYVVVKHSGKWNHHDYDSGPIKGGKDSASLQKHLDHFHSIKEDTNVDHEDETEIEVNEDVETEVDPMNAMMASALDRKPVAFQGAFEALIQSKAAELVANAKESLGEREEIDEISKTTMQSYAAKSAKQMNQLRRKSSSSFADAGKTRQTFQKRQKGYDTAAGRLHPDEKGDAGKEVNRERDYASRSDNWVGRVKSDDSSAVDNVSKRFKKKLLVKPRKSGESDLYKKD